jgi:hypothetical protein
MKAGIEKATTEKKNKLNSRNKLERSGLVFSAKQANGLR